MVGSFFSPEMLGVISQVHLEHMDCTVRVIRTIPTRGEGGVMTDVPVTVDRQPCRLSPLGRSTQEVQIASKLAPKSLLVLWTVVDIDIRGDDTVVVEKHNEWVRQFKVEGLFPEFSNPVAKRILVSETRE